MFPLLVQAAATLNTNNKDALGCYDAKYIDIATCSGHWYVVNSSH